MSVKSDLWNPNNQNYGYALGYFAVYIFELNYKI